MLDTTTTIIIIIIINKPWTKKDAPFWGDNNVSYINIVFSIVFMSFVQVAPDKRAMSY